MKDVQINKIEKNDIQEILEIGDEIFKNQLEDNKSYMYSATDWDISIKLVLNDEIIGFYLFNKTNIISDLNIFKNKIGIEGIALGVKKEYRGLGYGNLLIEKSYELFKNDFDYIHGQHLKTLNNLDDWEKKRTILEFDDEMFLSYKFFK